MMKLMLIVISVLVQLARSQHRFSPKIIEPKGNRAACPSAETVEELRQVIGSITLVPQCGYGIWHQVAFLNMSDPSQQCPSNWAEYNHNGVRACRRPFSRSASCSGIIVFINSQYSRVCGKVIGYPIGTIDAFTAHTGLFNNATINGPYLDGVSITHGNPRNHIWSFAAGVGDPEQLHWACPCVNNYTGPGSQSFVNNHYFCESGILDSNGFPLPSDKLWDGLMCSSEGTCCSDKTLPWFTTELEKYTNDYIEVRICADEDTNNEGTPIELIELYVQ